MGLNLRRCVSCVIFFSVAFLCASIPILCGPHVRYGDSSDYVMMAASIAGDADLVYDNGDLNRILTHRPEGTDFPAGMFLVRDPTGALRIGGHSFYYPAAAALFFTLFGVNGLQILNALLWAAVVCLIVYHFRSSGIVTAAILAFSGLMCSAAFDYILWHTPATWMLFLCSGFLISYRRRRNILAGAFLGIAAATQFPLLLWIVVPLMDFIRRKRSPAELILICFAAALCLMPQVMYYRLVIGAWQPAWLDLSSASRYLYYPLQFPGAAQFSRAEHAISFSRFSRITHLSPFDVTDAIFSPRLGLLWFYPFSLLAAWRMWRERSGGSLLLAGLAVLIAFCTAGRMSTHQVGLRYLNPVYPAFLLGFRTCPWRRVERIVLTVVLLLGLTFAVFPRGNSVESVKEKKTVGSLLVP